MLCSAVAPVIPPPSLMYLILHGVRIYGIPDKHTFDYFHVYWIKETFFPSENGFKLFLALFRVAVTTHHFQ